MARIKGIDLPKEKRGIIGLTYIYGIGSTFARNILKKANEIINNRSEEKERQYGPMGEGLERAAKIASGITGKDLTADDIFASLIALDFDSEVRRVVPKAIPIITPMIVHIIIPKTETKRVFRRPTRYALP